MQLGMIGLGRMGANMVRRLMRDGHDCVVFDVSTDAVNTLANEGATGAASMVDLAHRLSKPRAAWMMVPAAVVDATLEQLVPLLEKDDVVVDGGNSYIGMTSSVPSGFRPKESTMSTSVRAAACGVSSAASAR